MCIQKVSNDCKKLQVVEFYEKKPVEVGNCPYKSKLKYKSIRHLTVYNLLCSTLKLTLKVSKTLCTIYRRRHCKRHRKRHNTQCFG